MNQRRAKIFGVAIAVSSFFAGYLCASVSLRNNYIELINGYMNIEQLKDLETLNNLREGKEPEAISDLEASVMWGLVGRQGRGGISEYREVMSPESSGIKDLNRVLSEANMYLCKYGGDKLNHVRQVIVEQLKQHSIQGACNDLPVNK